MEVKTNFVKNDMIKILSNYKLGGFTDFKPITKATVQTNFLLTQIVQSHSSRKDYFCF